MTSPIRRLTALAAGAVLVFAGAVAPRTVAAAAPAGRPSATGGSSVPVRSAPAHHQDWAQFHYGPTGTGWNPTEHMLSPRNVGQLRPQWSFHLGDGSPIVYGSRVFVTSRLTPWAVEPPRFGLFALDRRTGHQLWVAQLADPPSRIAAAGGLVMAGVGTTMRAFRAASGDQVWSVPLDGRVGEGPTIADGEVYLGTFQWAPTDQARIMALELGTGAVRWAKPFGGAQRASLAVDHHRLFAPSDDGTLTAYDTATGRTLWSHSSLGSIAGGGPAVLDGIVYLTGDTNGDSAPITFAMRETTGQLIWQVPAGDDVHAVPAVSPTGVYVGAIDGTVHAFNRRTGAVLWTRPLGGEIWGSPAIANGLLYLTTESSAAAMSVTDGRLLWSTTDPVPEFGTMASPTVTGGVVYIAWGSGRLDTFHLGGQRHCGRSVA